MVEKDGPDWTVTLAFRNALRGRPALAQEYAAAKEAFSRRYAEDRDAYQSAKDEVVVAILEKIEREASDSDEP